MRKLYMRLWKEEEGQDLVEYGLVVALVSLAAVGAMGSLASSVKSVFSDAGSYMNSATS